PTAHVTRDLRMKQKVKRPPLVSLRRVRHAPESELHATYDHLYTRPGRDMTVTDEKRLDAVKSELRMRHDPNLALYMQRAGYRDIGGKKLKKRQVKKARANAPRTTPKRHRRRS